MDDFREAAKTLTKDGKYGFGVAPELARQFWVAQSLGGDIVKDGKANFASDDVVNALKPVIDMHNEDQSAVEPKEVGATWGGEVFGQEKAAMVIEGNWAIPFLADTFLM